MRKVKAQIHVSCAIVAQMISTFGFTTYIVQSLFYIGYVKSSHLLWLYSPVYVRPCRKPRRRGSFISCLGCSNGIGTVSRMAVSFNLPHITYAGTSETLSNKKEFSMLSRISYTMDAFASFYMDVLDVSRTIPYRSNHEWNK